MKSICAKRLYSGIHDQDVYDRISEHVDYYERAEIRKHLRRIFDCEMIAILSKDSIEDRRLKVRE